MARSQDNYKQVQQEDAVQQARKAWTQLRVEQIHRAVSAFEVLRRNGVQLKSMGDREEQFSCPFHGTDQKPSARVYPESTRGPSHAWCFVCQERWDAIRLWRKFNGGDETPFSRVLKQMEQAFGLTTPDIPAELEHSKTTPSKGVKEFETLYEVCENRLRLAKGAYRKLNDRIGYIAASSVLDKLRHRVEHRQLIPERGVELLRHLLAKIGERVQACPDE